MKLTGGDWSKGDAITAVACLAAILAIPGMPKLFHWDSETPITLPSHDRQTSTVFNGVVRLSDGTPIPRAHALLTLGDQVSKLMLSDSEGMFHIDVPQGTKTLHVSVYLDGFHEIDRDASPTTTSLEVFELSPILPEPGGGHLLQRPVRNTVQPKIDSKPLNTTVALAPTNSGITNTGQQTVYAPGQINNIAPNQGIQGNFYGAPRPVPQASFMPTPLEPSRGLLESVHSLSADMTRMEGEYRDMPGLELSISVADDFLSPTFRVVCSSTCVPTVAFEESGSNGNIMGQRIGFRTATRTGDDRGIYLLFSARNGVLEAGQRIICRLRSNRSEKFQILSFESITR